jgi:hypothetical protein
MKEHSKTSEIFDLTDAFELSVWNEIIELKVVSKMAKLTLRFNRKWVKIFFELGESTQAMEALDMSTDID